MHNSNDNLSIALTEPKRVLQQQNAFWLSRSNTVYEVTYIFDLTRNWRPWNTSFHYVTIIPVSYKRSELSELSLPAYFTEIVGTDFYACKAFLQTRPPSQRHVAISQHCHICPWKPTTPAPPASQPCSFIWDTSSDNSGRDTNLIFSDTPLWRKEKGA